MENSGNLQHSKRKVSGEEEEETMQLRRGPWTTEEDGVLVDYITKNGEGKWNTLARYSNLRRTGKSCRLRWLNYLRPGVIRGNITPQEQLIILDLHSRFGNKWSKMAQYLPGRTDNEIKNYWRTRVQKYAKQLNCDVGSRKFRDAVCFLWVPRLLERIQAASGGSPSRSADDYTTAPLDSLEPSPQASGGEIGGADQVLRDDLGYEHGQSTGGCSNPEFLDFEKWEVEGNLWNAEDIWF